MLAGEGAITIWNGITPEGRAEFYAWHLHEHMAERVGIPGFLRGRRYIRATAETHPEFFTLYETETPQVLLGMDYANRLNAPTPWTKSATQGFRDTARALTTVAYSAGPGAGGMLATWRFDAAEGRAEDLRRALSVDVLPKLNRWKTLVGLHLCLTDGAASAVKTAESKDRTDIGAAPNWVLIAEACSLEDLQELAAGPLSSAALEKLGARGPAIIDYYRLEFMRTKTAWS
ncbi:MAG: hypothetical protein ACOVVK_19550 [Elsteraceae bacterium]